MSFKNFLLTSIGLAGVWGLCFLLLCVTPYLKCYPFQVLDPKYWVATLLIVIYPVLYAALVVGIDILALKTILSGKSSWLIVSLSGAVIACLPKFIYTFSLREWMVFEQIIFNIVPTGVTLALAVPGAGAILIIRKLMTITK